MASLSIDFIEAILMIGTSVRLAGMLIGVTSMGGVVGSSVIRILEVALEITSTTASKVFPL